MLLGLKLYMAFSSFFLVLVLSVPDSVPINREGWWCAPPMSPVLLLGDKLEWLPQVCVQELGLPWLWNRAAMPSPSCGCGRCSYCTDKMEKAAFPNAFPGDSFFELPSSGWCKGWTNPGPELQMCVVNNNNNSNKNNSSSKAGGGRLIRTKKLGLEQDRSVTATELQVEWVQFWFWGWNFRTPI